MPEKNNIEQIIFSYLVGKTNIEEVQVLRKWLNESPVNNEQFKIIRNYWENNHWKIETEDQDQVFERLQHRIRQKSTDGKSIEFRPRSWRLPTSRNRLVGIAASILLLFCVGIYLFQSDFMSPESINEVATILKQNPAGQKSRITLPDGTMVWLNSESSISYPESFSTTHREIELQGEAYFDVSKDSIRSFTVHSNQFDVIVMGTSFNIQTYSDKQNAKISLIEGKIRVDLTDQNAPDHQPVYLNPGEQLSYTQDSNQMNIQSLDEEYVTGWKEGLLIFKNDTFSELKQKLERWYGVTLEVGGTPPDSFIVQGKFKNESLDNVLMTLQFGRDFSYNINDKLITIEFN